MAWRELFWYSGVIPGSVLTGIWFRLSLYRYLVNLNQIVRFPE